MRGYNKVISFNGIEYRSISQLLENLGIGYDRSVFNHIEKGDKTIEEIITIAANKKKLKRQLECLK